MIENFIMSELCPKYDVVFIDEAQDLSPIQWKMFEVLKKNSKYVILAATMIKPFMAGLEQMLKDFNKNLQKK